MKAACTHIGSVNPFNIGEHPIVLGSFEDLEDYLIEVEVPCLVFNLNGREVKASRITHSIQKNMPTFAQKLQELIQYTDIKYDSVAIDWPDGGIPIIPVRFWSHLVGLIKDIPGNGSIYIHCQGGHGRTGTMAAILAHFAGVMEADECPVSYIRGAYCDSACETKAQLYYVERVTGRTVVADTPSHAYTYTATPQTTTPGAKGYGNSNWGSEYGDSYQANKETINDLHKVAVTGDDTQDGLHWSQTVGYCNKNGQFLGNTYSQAISTLRQQKEKSCKTP